MVRFSSHEACLSLMLLWSAAFFVKATLRATPQQRRTLADGGGDSTNHDYHQPHVITVERSRKAMGSISSPKGSFWCNGQPAYWTVGHHNVDETPWCLQPTTGETTTTTSFENFDYADSVWKRTSLAHVDVQDALNLPSGPADGIDRHDCTTLDLNCDGIQDVVCGVGADSGKGEGYNEVYLTQPGDASLVKILDGRGLHKYPTMRNRKVVSLTAADGFKLVFMATQGVPRADGKPNQHRMFRLINTTNSTAGGAPSNFFFEEVKGPWIQYSWPECLRVVDVNQDGLDDLIMCNRGSPNKLYLQHADGSWSEQSMANDWRDARVVDVTGDGIVDLVVVGDTAKSSSDRSRVRIFEGTGVAPFFDFDNPTGLIYERSLPHASTAVEVLDVNSDGLYDIYVVQVDEITAGVYCKIPFLKDPWRGPNGVIVPGIDTAPDVLLVGDAFADAGTNFDVVEMVHAEPGCGSLVEQFGGNRTLLLAQGSMSHWGNNLLLQW